MRQAFDVKAAIPAAWKLLWSDNLKKRLKGRDFRGDTTYLTATDVVEQVRMFAREQADGKPWGATGRQWGPAMVNLRISTGRPGGLLAAVRRWLLDEVAAGRLEMFEFGRGHISGARYRPKGKGITKVERETMEAKARRRMVPRPIHYAEQDQYGYLGRAVCLPPRGAFYRTPRDRPRVTSEKTEVTCPRCKKRLDGPAAVGAAR